jgi:ethanolamine utilization protein EutJ
VTEVNRNSAGLTPEQVLLRAAETISLYPNGSGEKPVRYKGDILRVGVDLGTVYTVLVALDKNGVPLAGEYQYTQVVRDGLVVDFARAVDILRGMKSRLEARLKRKLTHAASGFPPGVPQAEVRTTAYVVEAAGLECPELIDEPSAANHVLRLENGVIVDIGGGTTGIAVVEDGKVVHTADEATGGTHISLVIAGAHNISFEEAEALKKVPTEQSGLFPVVRPVMEKMGTIVERNIHGMNAKSIILVGGTSIFPGIDTVIQEITNLPTRIAPNPLFVTPVGIAMHDRIGSN